ncbi:MAG: HEAT repeat domain-containing protein [Woronichinia naegeliana WA131]|uniref:HEAT repeat domain-containing protein n=1 Tax=Woronichinia naegeliana WA131 TaxID=2824559 RepID=A0A977PU17_9CYAN|nr:MAG: HEAT repeat domain-containing protein [Woronichinia naegeliana WA131]
MIEYILIWEGAKAAGNVFWPVLKSLVEDSAKDYAKDFFKDCLKNVFRLPEKDVQKEAYLTALEAFLQLFQQELKNADYQEGQIKQYLEPIQKFIEQPKVAAILGNAFEANCKSLDTSFLAKTWQEMNLPFLPEDFDWELIGKLYIRGVKQIIAKSEKLRPIYDVQLQAKQAEGIQELVGISPDFDLGRYAEGLREQYGNLKLESLDTTGVYYNELKLWKIFIAQNVRECQELLPPEIPKEIEQRLVKEGQLEKSQLTDEERDKRHHAYINQPIRLVWELLGDPTEESKSLSKPVQYAVILGDPGSGKSSLLQYLALSWAQRPTRDLSLFPIPLLIELRFYGRDKQAAKQGGKPFDFLSFLHGGNITCHLNQQTVFDKLNAGQGIALFDGIDEVFDPALRDEVRKDIHRFSNRFKNVQIIVTSRRLGYKAQPLRDAGFKHFMLQDLEIEQIEDFLERWHNLTFTDEADKLRKKERLIKAIQDSKAIRELARNPLLLTMMAILNRKQELPRSRSTLYEKASEVLLYQWDVEVKLLENPKFKDWKISIELDHKQKMLRKVACFMQSNKKDTSGNLISKTDLENILTESLREIIERGEPRMIARVMIEELRNRNFILCYLGADSYGFVHRTFLEYFCAWEFVWQFKETQTLKIEGLINDVFGKHWQDESWHEVLRLICGMTEPKFVADIIDFLLKQEIDRSEFLDGNGHVKREGLGNFILATNCFAEVRNKNLIATISEKILKILKHEIEQESEPWFNFDLADPLMSLITTNWKEVPNTLPWLKERALLDQFHSVRVAAVRAIAQNWKEDPDTLPWLKDRAVQDQFHSVRQLAVYAITQGWKEDPDTLPFLKDRALLDKNEDVRRAAVRAITQNWKEDPDTLHWFKDRALLDESEYVRQAAVNAITQNWKEDPNTLHWFKDRALLDESKYVRQVAINAITQNWKEDPDTLPLLKDRALLDESEYVRQAAVNAIAEGWKEDPDTLHWFKYLALLDKDGTVRQLAVYAITQGWKEDPDTLPLLKDRALLDEDYYVRRTAITAISEGWKEDPDTLPFLKNRALQDEEKRVRQVAVQAIIQNWQEDPELFEFLANIALNDPFKRKYYFQDNPSQTALEALLENFGDNPDEALEILNQVGFIRREYDFDDNPRGDALLGLLENFSDNPKTLEILNQVALNDSDEQLREFAQEKLKEWGTG